MNPDQKTTDEMLDCLRGLIDEIDRCGVRVSDELEAKVRAIVDENPE